MTWAGNAWQTCLKSSCDKPWLHWALSLYQQNKAHPPLNQPFWGQEDRKVKVKGKEGRLNSAHPPLQQLGALQCRQERQWLTCLAPSRQHVLCWMGRTMPWPYMDSHTLGASTCSLTGVNVALDCLKGPTRIALPALTSTDVQSQSWEQQKRSLDFLFCDGKRWRWAPLQRFIVTSGLFAVITNGDFGALCCKGPNHDPDQPQRNFRYGMGVLLQVSCFRFWNFTMRGGPHLWTDWRWTGLAAQPFWGLAGVLGTLVIGLHSSDPNFWNWCTTESSARDVLQPRTMNPSVCTGRYCLSFYRIFSVRLSSFETAHKEIPDCFQTS